jgi:hypothetical protein
VGPCRGFEGDCADLQAQFAEVQGPYLYDGESHDTLEDYVCTAFPDDAYVTDQLLVGLISVAVALPVDLFLARAFEIANEVGDAPESWLDAPPGKWKLLLGKDCHNDWHLADPEAPVSALVLWLVRYSWESTIASLLRLAAWLWARCTRGKKAAEAEAEAEEEEEEADDAGSTASAEARADAMQKRLYASAGLLGVYICWAIFSWFIFVRVLRCAFVKPAAWC